VPSSRSTSPGPASGARAAQRPFVPDVAWSDIGLVVEIDGAGHLAGFAATDDSLRQNWVVLPGETVIRMTVLGLRLHREEFMDQVCQAHALLSARGAA